MSGQMQVSAGGTCDLVYQFVWYAKHCRSVLAGEFAVRCEDLADGHSWPVLALKITSGHVHLLVKAHPGGSPSQVSSKSTGLTSRCMRTGFPHLRSRWQALGSRSNLAATAGAVPAKTVYQYTGTQHGPRLTEGTGR